VSDHLLQALVFAHAFATLAMCGLCWFVQVVHYPLLAEVGPERFSRYESEHVRRTTWIVAPLMLIELATAGLLVMLATRVESGVSVTLAWTGAGLLALVWMSTFGVQVPLHGRLQRSFDLRTVSTLVRSNWARTVAWSARGVLALLLVWEAGGVGGAGGAGGGAS
jgi:hypothetical protein